VQEFSDGPSLVEATLEDHTLPGISEGEIIVIRSTRRKKNVSAYRQGGRIVVSRRAMRERWGSCTGIDSSIRISDRLKGAPEYVVEYVLFHEAIHLHYFDHGPEFKELLARFPDAEKAEAYLSGYEAAETALTAPEVLKKLLNRGA